eukprot:scaffold33362_cov65-Attheya_sp.AAC.1
MSEEEVNMTAVHDDTDLTELVGPGENYAKLVHNCFRNKDDGNVTWNAAKAVTMEDFLNTFAAGNPARRIILQAWIAHYNLEKRFKQPEQQQQQDGGDPEEANKVKGRHLPIVQTIFSSASVDKNANEPVVFAEGNQEEQTKLEESLSAEVTEAISNGVEWQASQQLVPSRTTLGEKLLPTSANANEQLVMHLGGTPLVLYPIMAATGEGSKRKDGIHVDLATQADSLWPHFAVATNLHDNFSQSRRVKWQPKCDAWMLLKFGKSCHCTASLFTFEHKIDSTEKATFKARLVAQLSWRRLYIAIKCCEKNDNAKHLWEDLVTWYASLAGKKFVIGKMRGIVGEDECKFEYAEKSFDLSKEVDLKGAINSMYNLMCGELLFSDNFWNVMKHCKDLTPDILHSADLEGSEASAVTLNDGLSGKKGDRGNDKAGKKRDRGNDKDGKKSDRGNKKNNSNNGDGNNGSPSEPKRGKKENPEENGEDAAILDPVNMQYAEKLLGSTVKNLKFFPMTATPLEAFDDPTVRFVGDNMLLGTRNSERVVVKVFRGEDEVYDYKHELAMLQNVHGLGDVQRLLDFRYDPTLQFGLIVTRWA